MQPIGLKYGRIWVGLGAHMPGRAWRAWYGGQSSGLPCGVRSPDCGHGVLFSAVHLDKQAVLDTVACRMLSTRLKMLLHSLEPG